MKSLLVALALLFASLPCLVSAQIALPGLTDGAIEIPVTDDPAQTVIRQMNGQEELLEIRIQRMQERTRFFIERLDIRSRDLEATEREYVNRRSALGRRGPDRQATITELLEEIRAIRRNINRIEEEWIGHLDELAESQSATTRYVHRVEATQGELELANDVGAVEAKIDAIDLHVRQLQNRLSAMESQRDVLLEEGVLHAGLLEQSRSALERRDREVLAMLTVVGELPALSLGDEGEVGPQPPPLDISPAQRELIQLEDGLLALRVRRFERACELDRVRLARLEAARDHLRVELPVLEFERDAFVQRGVSLAARASDGLLGRNDGLITAPVLHQAVSHTQTLLLDPAGALEQVVGRIRPGPTRVPTGRGTLLAIALVGVLSMGLVLRNQERLAVIEPRSPGEATVLHALQAALPLLPVALVSFSLYALAAVPEALQPLYRFSAWVPAVVAAAVATGVSTFPPGGTPRLSPSIARYARFLVRFGAAVTCLIGLINTLLPLLGYDDEVRRLLGGVSLGWLLMVWLLLMVRKQEILGLIGANGDDPNEGIIKASIRRLYRLFALGPLAVYVLYAAGYSNLAGFLVQGGLVTLAVLMLAPWVHETTRSFAARGLGYPEGGGFFALKQEGAQAAYRAVAPLILLGVGLGSLLLLAAGWNSGERIDSLPELMARDLVEIGGSHVSLGSLFLLALTIAAMMLVGRQFIRLLNKHVYPIYDLDRGMASTMDTLSGYLVLLAGVVVSLDVVGLGIGFLTVFAGVIGIGVGFGSQTLAANFISGLILLFTRPVTVDDVIETSGVTGRVVRIAPFSTVVRTVDNLDVIIPNSDLLGGTVVNWTGDDDNVRVSVSVGVAYGSNVNLVEQLLMKAMDGEPRVLRHPRPSVRFDGFGESSLDFTMLPWLSDPEQRYEVASVIRHSVDRMFREHGIEIPFPQRDIHVKPSDSSLASATERGLEVRSSAGEVVSPADDTLRKAARTKAKRK